MSAQPELFSASTVRSHRRSHRALLKRKDALGLVDRAEGNPRVVALGVMAAKLGILCVSGNER